jgi:hypothetical protein
MRIAARYELAEEWRDRYLRAGRKEKGEILDAFCLATGYHRKYALTVLRGRTVAKAATGVTEGAAAAVRAGVSAGAQGGLGGGGIHLLGAAAAPSSPTWCRCSSGTAS